MQFLTSPDASLKPLSLTQSSSSAGRSISGNAAFGGQFARLLSGAATPASSAATEAESMSALTPKLLSTALGSPAEGQTLPLQRQVMVGLLPDTPVLPGADLQSTTDEAAVDPAADALPSTSWLARLFGLGPTPEDAAEVLDDLDHSLSDLGEIIVQLLGVKPLREAVQTQSEDDTEFDVEAALAQLGIDMPSEAVEQWVTGDTLVIDPAAVERLENFLHDELGLNLVQTDTVIQAMTAWVQNPPQVNITAEQLAAADADRWQEVNQLTQVVDELGGQFSSWLEQLNTDGEAVAEAAPELSKGLRTLADALTGKGQREDDGKAPSPAVMVARLLQSVQNSATSGSLPITLDNSRPEQALLLVPANPVSHDVVFNTTLVKMARESLATKVEAETRVAALNSTVNVSGDANSVVSLSLSQSDAPEQPPLLDLKRVDRPLVSAEVSRQLSERIQMMAQGEIKHATIRLDPPELGALDIKVTVHNDQTQVQITSPNPQVREALESQSVRLREILEQQGLSLANLDVRDQPSSNNNADSGNGRGSAGSDEESAEPDAPLAAAPSRPMGLVDHFV